MSISRPPPQRGIVVMNTPFGNSITTAEHAIAMMFALARQIPGGQCLDPGRQVGEEPLHGRRAHSTRRWASSAAATSARSSPTARSACKMKVVAFDPFLSPERAIEIGVEKVELDEICSPAPISSRCTRR